MTTTNITTNNTRSIGYTDLITQIEAKLEEKPHVIVAISGFGGSGKSHLAEKLRKDFNCKENQVVRIDHLYGPNPNGPDIFDQSDWPLLIQILEDVRSGKRLCYQGKGYRGEIIPYDEDLPTVIIVEGIRLLQPKPMSYFDISVWIDCPQTLARDRAKTRDRAQGEPEETVLLWDTDWGPKDTLYFETYHPRTLATFLYEQYQ